MIPIARRYQYLSYFIKSASEATDAKVDSLIQSLPAEATIEDALKFLTVEKLSDMFKQIADKTTDDTLSALAIFKTDLPTISKAVHDKVEAVVRSAIISLSEDTIKSEINQCIKAQFTSSNAEILASAPETSATRPTAPSSAPAATTQAPKTEKTLEERMLESQGSPSNLNIIKKSQQQEDVTPEQIDSMRNTLIQVLSESYFAIYNRTFAKINAYSTVSQLTKGVKLPTSMPSMPSAPSWLPWSDKSPYEVDYEPSFKSRQSKFKVKSSYVREIPSSTSLKIYIDKKFDEAYLDTHPNEYEQEIVNALCKWTNEIYDNVPESEIKSNYKFRTLVQWIIDYNINTKFPDIVKFPVKFKTKKEVVDFFINEVAGVA